MFTAHCSLLTVMQPFPIIFHLKKQITLYMFKLLNLHFLRLVVYLFLFTAHCSLFTVNAQPLDKIIAVIGDGIVLESDVDNQYNYLLNTGEKDNGDLRCQAIEGMIINKLLLAKAEQDSITVSDDEVSNEVNRRVEEMMKKMGGIEQFVEVAGKSPEEFKQDVREPVKEELLIERQRNRVLASANVTPKEVNDYFRTIPKDSLGLLPAEVEISHIVATPPFSEESKKAAKKKIEEARKKVVEEKKDFTEIAKKYSEEPGAYKTGGNLGEFQRGMMVPEFEATAYSMRVGDISQVIETEFGYHVIKLLARRGEILNAQHILVTPDRDTKGDSIAMVRLKKALRLVRSDSMTFEQAAIAFSQERGSKDCGGCVQNPKNGELRIPLSALDPEFFFKVDVMKQGEISEPMEYTLPDGTRAFHVLYLKKKIPAHNPNMRDDYKKINNAANVAKQTKVFDKWIVLAKKNVYIDIKTEECAAGLAKWKQKQP